MNEEAVHLLTGLINIPSLSGEEKGTAAFLESYFSEKGIGFERIENNVIVRNKHYTPGKQVLLLNSHHDTVKPNLSWTKNPFSAEIQDNRIYGLGSNDAGGCLVSLISAFLYFYEREDLSFNIVLVASAEEEISGKKGIELVLKQLEKISFAIVGEPTSLQMSIAEKGLMVLDVIVKGKAGHAARNEGVNAIYKALDEIQWFRTYKYPNVSETLGEVNMNVTMVEAGQQHNVIPPECKYVVDIRSTDKYSNDAILGIIRRNIGSEVTPRSTRLQPSGIDADHPLVRVAEKLGITTFGSPTLSDQALIPYPSVKIGPGDSNRSHTADEYIYVQELEAGIKLYLKIIDELNNLI